jgi:hypothetical protein
VSELTTENMDMENTDIENTDLVSEAVSLESNDVNETEKLVAEDVDQSKDDESADSDESEQTSEDQSAQPEAVDSKSVNNTNTDAAPSAQSIEAPNSQASSTDANTESSGIPMSTWLWGLAGAGAIAAATSGGGGTKTPDAPSVSLKTDSGATDGLTNVAEFTVTGVDEKATWEYSTNGGSSWQPGSGNSFSISSDGSYTVAVRQTIGKKTSDASASINVTLDTEAPTTSYIASSSTTGEITITFSESMDASSVPSADEFVIKQGDVVINITNIEFYNDALIITTDNLSSGSLQVTYTGSSLRDAATNALDGFKQIIVSDGYIKGAKVYLDANNDGVAQADELLEGVTTDAKGQVILNGAAAEGNIIVVGGVNTDTGAVNKLVMKAPAGYSTINPLTTLVKAVQDSSETEITQAEAESVVLNAIGVTLAEGQTLASYDPQADTSEAGLAAKKAVAQVAVVLVAAVNAAEEGSADAVQETVTKNIAKVFIDAPAAVTFDATVVDTILKDDTGTSVVSAEVATNVVASSTAISQATTLEEVITEQAKAIDNVAPLAASVDLAAASDSNISDDNVTSDATPTVTITLAADDAAGGAAVAGDTVQLFNGDTLLVTYVLTAADVAAGSVDITSTELTDGDASFTVKLIDRAENVSELSVAEVVSIDTVGPEITSLSPDDVNENVAIGTKVYSSASTDANSDLGIVYSLKEGSDAALTIDAATGEVTLLASPDHETATSHSFTVVATDLAGNSTEKALVLNIIDLDDSAPTITSAATATAIDENSGASQVVYTATSTDDGDISDGVSYSLKEGASSDLSINADSGAVTLAIDPDHETVSSYTFTVVVTDAAGNATEQEVSLSINDVDDTAPTITSTDAVSVDENTAAGETLYTAISDDSADVSDGVTYSLKAGSDAALSIDKDSGAVTSSAALDHETQDSYSFTVVATDAAGNSAEHAVTLSVTDLNEAPTAVAIADQVVVTDLAFSSDLSKSFSDEDAGDTLTYSLTSGELPSGLTLSEEGVLSGTVSSEVDSASFTITATDAAGLTKEQTFNLKVVAAPVVDSISVVDTSAPTNAGLEGETVTVTLTMSETFTLDTTAGSPTIGLLFGASTTEVAANYVSTEGATLTFTATTPAGNATSVSLGSITLNGATLVGDLSAQPWETSSVGQSAAYTLDNAAPEFTSAATASVDENTAVDTVVYSTTVDDVVGGVTYALKAGSDAALTIDAATGEVSLAASPDYETATTHVFTVVATDALGNNSEQEVTLSINNLDEVAPAITSSSVVDNVDENVAVGTTVYTATSDDTDDISAGVTYSLKEGSDAALTIDASSGAVTLLASPDHETATTHVFTVVATDAAGNSSEQELTLNINDLDEVAPTITSAATATAIDENSGASQVVYTATSTDDGDISDGVSYSLKEGASSDLSINADSGAVTLAIDPDHETVSSYTFTVVVTDAAGNATEQEVSLTINDVDDTAPTITSSDAVSVDENTAAGETLYTATSDDSADVSDGVTYSLKAGSDAALSIDKDSGAVTSSAALDHETQDSYAFTVVATDAAGNAKEQAVTLSINDLNEAPTSVEIKDQVVVTDIAFSSDLSKSFSDQDADDTLTFALTSGELPSGLSLSEAGVLSGTVAAEVDSASFTITATDAAGLTKEQTFNLKVVAAPVVDSISVADTTSPSDTGVAGETVQVTLKMSEEFTLDTTNGNPSIGIVFGSSTTEVVGSYVSHTADTIVFAATAPLGDASDVTLNSISLSGLDTTEQGGVKIVHVDNGDGTITLQFFVADAVKSSFADGVENVDISFNYNVDDFETVSSGDIETFFNLAVPNLSVAGEVTFAGAGTSAYSVDSSDPMLSITLTPKSANVSYEVSVSDVIFNNSNMDMTVASYGTASLTGDLSGQPWEVSSVGQSASYLLDNAKPEFTSATTSSISEYATVGDAIYTAVASDVNTITYSLAAGADASLTINSETGAVSLSELPVNASASEYTFTVVATDVLNNSSSQAVTVTVDSASEVVGSGVIKQGGVRFNSLDNGDGTYTWQFFVADSLKSSFPDGIENIDLKVSFTSSDFETIASADLDTFFSLAVPNLSVDGEVFFAGAATSSYSVDSADPMLSIVVTPVDGAANMEISISEVIFNNSNMMDTQFVYGDTKEVTGTAADEAFILKGGDASIATGDGNDVLVLNQNTGDAFKVTDFTSGTDSIEFGDLLSSVGYTSVADEGTAADNVAMELIENPADILALLKSDDSSLDNMFGAAADTENSVAKLFYDADPAAGSVDIQTFDLDIGAALADLDDQDITGFIA